MPKGIVSSWAAEDHDELDQMIKRRTIKRKKTAEYTIHYPTQLDGLNGAKRTDGTDVVKLRRTDLNRLRVAIARY